MAERQESDAIVKGSPKLMGWVGLGLFLMGVVSYFLIGTRDDPKDALKLAAGVGVLCSLGLTGMVLAGLGRLEARVRELETKAKK